MSHRSCAISIGFGLLLSSCASPSYLLFHANFEQDQAEEKPNPSPPGDPAGDSIEAPYWARVRGGHFVTSRVLRIPAPQWDSDRVRLVGIAPPAAADTLTAMWVGCVGDPWDGPSGRVHVGLFSQGSSWPPLVGLEFQDGHVHVRAWGEYLDTSGSYEPRVPHVVVITVSKASSTFDLTVMHSGTTEVEDLVIDDQPLGVIIGGLPTPVLEIAPRNGAWQQVYEIDEILLTARPPEPQQLTDLYEGAGINGEVP